MRLLVASDPRFARHETGPGHPERPARIGAVLGGIAASGVGEAVIEVTAKPHTGCAKFTRRFGLAAHRWVNGRTGQAERLRGICAKVVLSGTIAEGDTITKLGPS